MTPLRRRRGGVPHRFSRAGPHACARDVVGAAAGGVRRGRRARPGAPGGPGRGAGTPPPRRHAALAEHRCSCNGCYDAGTTHSHGALKGTSAPSRGFSKQGTRTGSPANPRSQSRASCRRPVSTLKTHKRRPFGRTSAPPTQRDASARGLVPVNLTHNLGYYTTNPPRAPPPQPFDAAAPKDAAAAPKDAAAAPPRKR